MKKVALLIIFLFFLFSASAQKIADKKGNIQDLKQSVEMYAVVVLTPQGAMVGINEIGAFHFVDESHKPIELRTTAQVLNFMHRHGWDYINTIGGTNGAAPQYIFKKRK